MAYRIERETGDLIIDGFEQGVAPSPHKGIANIQGGNIATEPGEVMASFSRTQQSQNPITNGTLTTVGSNSNLFTSSSTLQAGQWINISSVSGIKKATSSATVSALTIGGGGAGGASSSTGAGAGGDAGTVTTNTYTVAVQAYTITVGAAGAAVANAQGGTGGTSSFGSLSTAAGGVGGVQGTNGVGHGAGGAGASGAGGAGSGNTGGNGGNGVANSITGASVTYAGGAGGAGLTTKGTGGTGGGGNGGVPGVSAATAGTDNLGAGGGGNAASDTSAGAAGGKGVVIISYTTGLITATGGSITTAGGNTIHTFNSTGTFTVSAITDVAFSTGAYYVSYYNGTQVKLSSFYDPTVASAVAFTTGGTATFSTTPNMSAPVAQATEKYNDGTATQYRYYMLDAAGLVWVYDTAIYASTLANNTVGETWFLPDKSTTYFSSASAPTGIGVINGWLLVFPGSNIFGKPTVVLGDTTSASTTWSQLPAPVLLMSKKSTTNTHYVLTGHQGRLYYTDGRYIGSIFPNTSLLTALANVQSYCSYTGSSGTGTITAVLNGSVPFINSTSRVPAVFFTDKAGTQPTNLTAATIYWIGDYAFDGTFSVYSASSGGSAINIQTGASGNQYFNTFYLLGSDANAGGTNSTVTFSNQKLTLPAFETAQSLVEVGSNVMVGCSGNIVYVWNQVDLEASSQISLPESNVVAMLTVNQMAYLFAGAKGSIYITDGSSASLVLKVPDYCAGVPGSPATYVEPVFTWGGVNYIRGRVFFSILDQTATKAGNCGGIWSFIPTQNLYIGQDTGIALRLENENSYGSYNGYAKLIIRNENPTTGYPLFWSPWISDVSTPTYGIDYSNTGTSASFPYIIETDGVPSGTMLDKKTYSQVEFKLATPLDTAATVVMKYRKTLTDAWSSAIKFSTEGNRLSGVAPASFEKNQWLQIQITATPITSSAATNSFVRLSQLRIR